MWRGKRRLNRILNIKSSQVVPQDNEDVKDKHYDQNLESRQDVDKRKARTSTFKSPKPILELETWVL